MFKTVDLPYEIRMTVTLAGEPAFAGMERVEVVVSAEEHIDRHHHARVDLVHHYSAPSFIYADQLGYKLLYHLGRRLTLA